MFYIVRLIDGTVIDFEGKCTAYAIENGFVHFRDDEKSTVGSVNADCVKYIIDDECLDSIQDIDDTEDDD